MNGDYDQLAQQRQLQEELKIVHEAVSKIMDKKARERLANVKMVKPEMAMQLELYLLHAPEPFYPQFFLKLSLAILLS